MEVDKKEDKVITMPMTDSSIKEVDGDIKELEVNTKENEELFNRAYNKVSKLGLVWNFRSIEYIVNRENITFNQLRSCVFKGNGEELRYDIEQAVKYLIVSGMINYKTCTKEDYDECMNKAYAIMEDWRENYGFIGILHILLINVMEKKHFFMGTQDVKILEHMSLKNLQKDLVMGQVSMDLQTKISQSQALQS